MIDKGNLLLLIVGASAIITGIVGMYMFFKLDEHGF